MAGCQQARGGVDDLGVGRVERHDLETGHATHAPDAHDAPDPERVVELDEVGALADGDPAAVRDAEQGQRVGARRGRRDRQRHAGRDEVADRIVERDDRPGQRGCARRGSRAPRRPRPRDRRSRLGRRPCPASEIASLTRSSRSAGFSRRMSGPDGRIDVDLVGDELDVGRVVEQRGDGQARRAMVDAAHRIEQVGRRPAAGRVPGPRLLRRSRPSDPSTSRPRARGTSR